MSIVDNWLGLPFAKKIISGISVAATLVMLFWMGTIATEPKLDLLYSGLEPSSAGEIVSKLEAMDVVYSVKGNAIYADSKRRDSLRLELAREGLPQQSVIGYELFDNLNSFAMSSEMFDTAYWRAKEGELVRTILSLSNVKGARVHLGTDKKTSFGRQSNNKSASVTVATVTALSMDQAKAIQYMTALSVVGLEPQNVAIIDSVAGLIAGPGIDKSSNAPAINEIDRARKLKQDLLHLLEARVGLNNVRVNVSLEVERKRETATERVFDPDGRVLRSQTTSETSGVSSGTRSAVTVASNLPEGAAGGGNSNEESQESSETVAYEISEILKNTETLPGAIKRISVAILLNDPVQFNDVGERVSSPRSDTELSALTELVNAAAGLNLDRGDVLTIKSMPFDVPTTGDLVMAPGIVETFMETYLWSTVQSLIFGFVAIFLGMFVVKPLLFQPAATADAMEPISLNGNPETSIALSERNALGITDQGGLKRLTAEGANDPLARLDNTVSEQMEDASALLSSWLSEPDEVTR